MNNSEETINVVYQSLGKIFYCIAAADKLVRNEEIQALNKIIKCEWLNRAASTDNFGKDSEKQIALVFYWLANTN